MKRSHLSFSLALAVLFAAAMPALANGKTEPPPVNTPPATTITQPVDINLGAAAAAQAGAQAGAISGSLSGASSTASTGDSTSSATGGNSKSGSYAAGGSGGSGGALNDNSSSRVLLFPAPVWTQVPQAAGCIATNSRSGAIGWNFISGSSTEQKSDPACVGIIMAKAAYDHCHFESEYLITNRVYQTVFPGAPELPMAPGTRNHTIAECEELKRPRLVVTPTLSPPPAPVVAPVTISPAPQACVLPAPAPVAKAAPKKRPVVAAKPKPQTCS